MPCTHCQHLNPPGAKFCNACGAKLEVGCAACQHLNPPESRFCNECGASLSEQARVNTSPESALVQSPRSQVHRQQEQPPVIWTPSHLAERIRAVSLTDGERKTITALFADLKGSTALIEGLDPEEARAIIDPALQLMMDAVHRYEGYVAQALGDGIFALFGAPIAHEDHPQRALYAALRMQEDMRRYGDQMRLKHGVPLAMRVGINTGEVVVRSIRKDDLHTDYVPVGHSTNLAARMEQMATPGSILATAYTHKLTEGYFEFKPLGQTHIKGVEEPLAVYEVLGAGPLRTRLQVAAQRGLTRFVGRQTELEQMRTAFAEATAGRGQIAGVMGEPGLGKSRLFYEFKLLTQAGCLLLEAYSISHGKASPYLPVIELLKSYFDIKAEDDERKRQEQVTRKVLRLDRSLDNTLPYLFALLGIEEQPSPLQQMDPQIRRKRTFEALKKLFLCESLNQPLILIFEDLHWIDSETQGFLDTLSEGIASAKILLLVNYRPEYRHEWGQKTYYTQVRLTPFGKGEGDEFLTALLGQDSQLTTLTHQILAKTEGTPFFIEEVVRMLVEAGTLTGDRGHYTLTQHVTTLQLPTTVYGVLAARIDRLTLDEKSLLQHLAVLGREFPLGLVRQVIAQPEEDLYRLLSALQRKEFLYEQPAFPEVEYLFKHALTQEVAYNSVLAERRKVLHEQTARAIEQLYHDRLEEHYNELAHHYQRSGSTEKAIEYLQKAGQLDIRRSAYTEAIHRLTEAMRLFSQLQPPAAYQEKELGLLLTLGPALRFTKGSAAPEVEAVYTRALELCQQSGSYHHLTTVLMGLGTLYCVRGELSKAQDLTEQLITVGTRHADQSVLLAAQSLLGEICFRGGMFTTARHHLETGMSIYSNEQHYTHGALYGLDTGVLCLSANANVLWALGYPVQAWRCCKEALTLAHHLQHPYSIAVAMHYAAMLHLLLEETGPALHHAEGALSLANQHGFPLQRAVAMSLAGWAHCDREDYGQGITLITEAEAALRSVSAGQERVRNLTLLGYAHSQRGDVGKGRELFSEAMAQQKREGTRWHGAELYRLSGQVRLLESEQPEQAAAEAASDFLTAIEIAQQQHAKSFELRATVSLAHLWQQQGKRAEAHQMLLTIYNWFTEGFDTRDLQEAQALMTELYH